ncbi:hypothetical protein HJFPF1_06574 [Paramyrothecium foliicola]|nr:hypothetical protein HJFPF1_06574 [Paramyrothecium foliicola]
MDAESSLPGTPAGGPLQAITPERVNQRDSIISTLRSETRDSSVHDKISQFNNLSLAMQSKQLERKTADAALKRAMLGREEAESEMRRYKDELRCLRKAVDEGKERERRVGERLETVMEQYGRAKETHAHTQALWEKEIRRARKETFKTQSSIVKLQEELKSARSAAKQMEEDLEREKERSRTREQEAFTARYQIVGVQEQLEQALERIKLVEQERDAFKTAAKNEEVARIAAEGRIPLPPAESQDDEFASPKKLKVRQGKEPRVSLSAIEIMSSEASELEIEDLTLQVRWERQRADRAEEMIEFMQAECEMHCCPCSKSALRRSLGVAHATAEASAQDDAVMTDIGDSAQDEELDNKIITDETNHDEIEEDAESGDDTVQHHVSCVIEPPPITIPVSEHEIEAPKPKAKKQPRLSTVFCPQEGIFRTVSEHEAAIMEAQEAARSSSVVHEIPTTADALGPEPSQVVERNTRMYARTPSVDPPDFALLAQERMSLASLLNAPHSDAHSAPLPSIPTYSAEEEAASVGVRREGSQPPQPPRPHTSAASYAVTTTTTTVPIRDENYRPDSSFAEKLRTPSNGSNASFDLNDPALTPTMTREQALAKIRERRGRARSAAQGAATPRRKMVEGKDRRHMSAPTGKTTGKARS